MSNIISFFQKLIKGEGVGIGAGGWKIFQKLISGGGGTIFRYSRVDNFARSNLEYIVQQVPKHNKSNSFHYFHKF